MVSKNIVHKQLHITVYEQKRKKLFGQHKLKKLKLENVLLNNKKFQKLLLIFWAPKIVKKSP